jgi:MFS family permease
LREVSSGLAAGARHVHQRPGVRRALAAISATRVVFGLSTIGTLLLYRNYFTDHGLLRAGLVGLGQAVAAATVGYVAAAVVTPTVARRIGKPTWIASCYLGAGVAQLAGGLPFRMLPLLFGAAAIGFASSGAKICVDTIVQEQIDDDYRGRVFSFYDTLFNVTFVVAAVVAAFTLPADGHSTTMVVALTAGYLLTAAGYAVSEARATRVSAGVSAPAQA